ncbi:MAG: 50S ribosomal protein L18 [Planctomycetes bacterium]|jgi:large subunit ribosomal protein L18|nr:50S ribosomal protein L18 [Planctomycetota bacterium]MBT6453069.1 50S ribosomal protein L18 [Planctomycetota bacterium]MBT6541101.1 50S ribosomal protein L18 [Planctomycetota bacterium]MBT6785054.1 50S ribosomal protein L18 [Planctomycetota bacterium]MBT6968091.1 50S ribosomal protein L18 [Planctomycetota bacterium]
MQATKKKLVRRKRRRQHIRKNLKGSSDRPRLTVYRSAKHIYCQAIDDFTGVTLVSASSMAKDVREGMSASSGNVEGATSVGTLLATRLKEKGISRLSFDRNGYKYHGRVQAVAEALRKEGIEV